MKRCKWCNLKNPKYIEYHDNEWCHINFDDKYLYDPEVTDCQFKLYMLLLPMSEEEQDKRYKEFEEVYNKLSKEKQEYIKEDFRKLLEEQDKNNKEKEKKI